MKLKVKDLTLAKIICDMINAGADESEIEIAFPDEERLKVGIKIKEINGEPL